MHNIWLYTYYIYIHGHPPIIYLERFSMQERNIKCIFWETKFWFPTTGSTNNPFQKKYQKTLARTTMFHSDNKKMLKNTFLGFLEFPEFPRKFQNSQMFETYIGITNSKAKNIGFLEFARKFQEKKWNSLGNFKIPICFEKCFGIQAKILEFWNPLGNSKNIFGNFGIPWEIPKFPNSHIF